MREFGLQIADRGLSRRQEPLGLLSSLPLRLYRGFARIALGIAPVIDDDLDVPVLGKASALTLIRRMDAESATHPVFEIRIFGIGSAGIRGLIEGHCVSGLKEPGHE
jgi:hypothetical protein